MKSFTILTVAAIVAQTAYAAPAPIIGHIVKAVTSGPVKDILKAGAGAVAGPAGSLAVEAGSKVVKKVSGVKLV